MRPRPGRGSAAQSTHRELDSLPGGLRDPPGCTGDPVPVPSCSACSGRPVPHLSPDLKHSLTRTSPHLNSNGLGPPRAPSTQTARARAHWPPAPESRGRAPWRKARRGLGRPPKDLRQAAHPLVLDCALYERECNRPHVRSNAFTSPASPHPHGITSSAIGSLFLLPGGSCVYNRRFTVVSFNPPPSHHAVKAIRAGVYGRMGLSPPDFTPRPDRRRYRRPTDRRYAQPAAAPGPTPGSWAAANPQTKWKRKTLCSN